MATVLSLCALFAAGLMAGWACGYDYGRIEQATREARGRMQEADAMEARMRALASEGARILARERSRSA